MSNVIELRKEPRTTGLNRPTRQISSAHISPFVQKILGLARETSAS